MIYCFHYSSLLHVYSLIFSVFLMVKLSIRPSFIMFFAILFLSIRYDKSIIFSHLQKMQRAYGAYVLDHTGPLMVMVIKLTSFAYDLWDESKSTSKESTSKSIDLLDFLSFLFFIPGVLAGPAMTYKEYKAFMDHTMFSGVDMFDKDLLQQRTLITRKKILHGYLFMLIYLIGRKIIKLPFFFGSYFASLPFLYKLLIIHVNGFIERCKYYFVWTLAEASLISVGIGFNGIDKNGISHWFLFH